MVFSHPGAVLLNRRSSKEQEQQQQTEKVTKKSSFSMGFRSYIRQFLVAILMLFRLQGPAV